VKLNDKLWGVLMLALALAVLWNVHSFPPIPGQNIGPSAFPALLAGILAACAVLLIVRGVHDGGAWITFGEWTQSRPHVGNFLLTIAALAFYIVAANRLGFILSISLILLALFLKLGVKPRLALPVAVGTTFFIHLIFYKLLRVSLPWGVLPVLY
jgi:putative tricarboxylic transport membrane protein